MALIVEDRIKETSTTTGTGAFTLAGAMTGHRAFSAVMTSPSDTCYYTIQGVDANGNPTAEWETGLGTYSGANTLTRTTVHKSSNSNAAVSFSAGTKQVFIDLTAAYMALLAKLVSPSFTTPTLGAAVATSINFGATDLANYQEGTWTPSDASGAALTLTTTSAVYTRIGRVVFYQVRVAYPANASGATATLGGFPLTQSLQDFPANVYPNGGGAICNGYMPGGSNTMIFQLATTNGVITNANLAGLTLRVEGFYYV